MLNKQASAEVTIKEVGTDMKSAIKSSAVLIVEPPADSASGRSTFRGLPWLGLTAITVSVLTVIASYLVLRLTDGRQIAETAFQKPTPWLSAITSINSVCLYIALVEGLGLLYRRHISGFQSISHDSNDLWWHGTSKLSLPPAGHRSYPIAIAIILVIATALNGFLLQNTIGERTPFHTQNTDIQALSLVSLPEGWSGTLGANGQAQLDAQIAADLNQNLNGKPNVFNTSTILGCQPNATCYGQMPTIGFKTSCKSSLQPYSLPPDSIQYPSIVTGSIFSSSLNWTADKPNSMYLRMSWKGSNDSRTFCTGNYEVRDCEFEIGVVAQNVVVKSVKYGADVPSEGRKKGDVAYTYQLDDDEQYSYKTDSPLAPLPVLDGASGKTMIGGLAQFFARYYTSGMDISYGNGAAGIVTKGFYSSMISLNTPANAQLCNTTVVGSPAVDLADEVVKGIRRITFGVVAASLARDHTGIAVSFSAKRVDDSVLYAMDWKYWVASLIVTLLIVLSALLVFLWFWRLQYRGRMRPLDSAPGPESNGARRQIYYSKRWTR